MEWYMFALGSALCFTFFQIFRKKGLQKTHAMNFESVRMVFVFFISLFLIPFIDWSFDKSSLLIVYVVSLLGTAGILFAAKSFRHNDISLISPLGNLRPAFIAIIAFFFLHESLRIKEITGIIIILIGAYLLESNHNLSNILEPLRNLLKSKHSLLYILASFIFSICSVLDKYIVTYKITNVFTYFFIVWFFITLNFNLIHTLVYGIKDSVKCLKQTKHLPFLVALFSAAGNIFALKAFSMAYVSLVSPVLMLTTLLVVLFGGRFFHEKYRIFRLATSALMLVGVYLVIT